MTQWEYVVVLLDEENEGTGAEERHLDRLGEEGWELVSVVVTRGAQRIAYMKRARR